MNKKLFEIDKYDSNYPDARLYRCDKNFVPRLCAMVEKIYRNESGRIDDITEQIATHAVDYLFSSETNIDESAPVDEKPEAQYNPETAKATYPKYPHITGEIVPAAPVDDVVDAIGNLEIQGEDESMIKLREIGTLVDDIMNCIPDRQPEVDALKKRVDELEGQCEVLKLTLINHKCNNH